MRSGTTLLSALVSDCFALEEACESETHLWRAAPRNRKVHLTKYPGDEVVFRHVLKKDPNLWFIYMLRDPRDVVVSIHGMDRSTYFTNLRHWKESVEAAHAIRDCPRFLEVRYEELVRDADAVQRRVMDFMPFLKKTADFSTWDGRKKLTPQYAKALNGVRKVDPASIGAWRRHKGRLLAQMRLHGDLSETLIALGYEKNKAWLQELEGVEPNERLGLVADRIPAGKAFRRRLREHLHARLYLIQRAVLER